MKNSRDKNILCNIVITRSCRDGQQVEYKVVDREPSFISLNKEEKNAFIDEEEKKIKDFLNQHFVPK